MIGAVAVALILLVWSSASERRPREGHAGPQVKGDAELDGVPHSIASRAWSETSEASQPQLETRPEIAREAADAEAVGHTTTVVRLQVLDAETLEPIQGARARWNSGANARQERTDEEGRAVLRWPGLPWELNLKLDAPGYFHRIETFERQHQLVVALHPATKVAGTVLDVETKEPIPRAAVRFVHDDCRSCEDDLATSDEKGKFSLAGVPRGKPFVLFASATQYPETRVRLLVRDRRSTHPVGILLGRGTHVVGRVSDAERRLPLPGSTVTVADTELDTDEEGVFEGWVKLDVHRGVRIAALGPEGRCRVETLVIGTWLREQSWLELFVPLGVTLRGQVFSGLEPIAGARVVATSEHAIRRAGLGELSGWGRPVSVTSASDSLETFTAADGSFEIPGLAPWSERIVVTAGKLGFESDWVELTTSGAPTVAVPRLALHSNLTSETSREAQVQGFVSVNGRPCLAEIFLGEGATPAAWAAEDGAYAVRIPAQRAVALSAAPHPFGRTWYEARADVELDAGEITERDLEVAVPEHSIEGTVLFDDRRPVAGARVTATFPYYRPGVRRPEYVSTLERTTWTDTDGRFRLDVLDPPASGRYEVVAEHDAFLSETRFVPVGSEDVDFVFAPTASVLLRVRDTGGKLTRHATIGWRRVGEGWYQETTLLAGGQADPAGWLEARLPCGRLELVAWREKNSVSERPLRALTLLADESDPPRLELQLVDESGQR